MARLYRDAYGVPHVRASSVLDLARAQGEVTARDRLWQLEHQRRRATGTLAEVFGPDALPWDRFARRTRIVETAARALDQLSEESRAFVTAYVEGVNAGLYADAPELTALGLEPGEWQPWTPLAVFLAQHLLFGSFPGKVWEHRARQVLGDGPDGAALLAHEGPGSSGSNAWAVGGGRTASGLPLIGGDPHRTFESPGVYQQVRLACDDRADSFDVMGFTFPGVPGVQHFAHAGGVAWAITNAVADYQDLYAEQLRRVGGGIEALGPAGWEPADARVETIAVREAEPVEVEVVATPRGLVVGDGLTLRTASWELGDLGFDALLPLLRARDADDVDRALDAWVEPVNNVVVADRAGAVRYRLAGRVPVRSEANRHGIVDAADPATAWQGWLDPAPREEVGADGCVVTANERRGPESAAVGTSFAPPHRADRLRTLVGDRTDLTAADFAAFHADVLMPLAGRVQELLRSLDAEGPVAEAILAWDGRMDADSAGAAAFAAWRSALIARLAAEPVFAPLSEPAVDEPLLLPWLDPAARVGGGLESLLAAGAPFGIDVRGHAAAALADAEGHAPRWGDTHVFTPLHAFDVHGEQSPPALPTVGLGGDADCVCCTGGLDADHSAWRGSVARYVWDLADPAGGGWVVPLGASADPRSPHHADQLPLWTDVRLAPLERDWGRLTLVGDASAQRG